MAVLAAGAMLGPAAVPAFADGSIRSNQWHLDAMHASEMWNVSKGGGITVAVIDGGFKLDHPDLVGQFLPGKDFSGSSGGVGSDAEGHGTQMASLIAGTGKGQGGTGAYGLAPAVKILPLKISNGSEGAFVTTDFLDQIGQAVDYAVSQGAKVINISQGVAEVRTSPEDVAKLTRVLASARAKGSLVVSSVGNSAQKGNLVEYPGALPNVVGVGAVDRNGTVTAESETGPQVALVAPGEDMVEACTSDTGYCKSHGTSDASALVSASAALIWSAHKDWTANQVLRVLINTAGRPNGGTSRTDSAGWGAVRPRIALTDPGDPGPADVSPLPADAATPSAAPSASASASVSASAAPSPAGAASGDAPTAQPKAEASSGSGSALPIVGGVVAGLVVVAGVVFAVLRRRKAAAQPVAAVPLVAPPVYQPPVPPEDNPYAK
ncbi:type VII secretion-associated serine protease mycosin [Kitasatospora cathayae]|uniref:Type VII secretion-associated serine protease mycosin n=1 Tax=Kitasatospora cathayae TaxID=3004092 RepID=A0ABY7Q500_9ACTN|nr:type VII secretion-associated serine protease mycosin [Kitasatospora sp. HUAS 3-15]WBP87306.1 type VII secretion-associated serine protease mycosin [Kitasatospora sp. HUAS 3-15]